MIVGGLYFTLYLTHKHILARTHKMRFSYNQYGCLSPNVYPRGLGNVDYQTQVKLKQLNFITNKVFMNAGNF